MLKVDHRPHAALHAAIVAEQHARAFYRRMAEAYGARGASSALLADQEKRLALLSGACRHHGTPVPADAFSGKASIAGNWLDDCRRAARGEVALIRMYQQLAPSAGAPDLTRIFDKLQRQSLNRRLPRLLRAAATAGRIERMHASYGVSREEAHMQHGFLSNFLERTFSWLGADHRTTGSFSPRLGNAPPALLMGLAVGGAMAYALKRKSPPPRKEG